MPALEAAKAILFGVWRTIKQVLLTLGILATIGVLGLVLALPLWAFSSFRPRIYTWFALVLLGAGVVFLLVRRVARRSRQDGGLSAWGRLRLLPALRRTGIVLAFIAAAYSAAVFLARGLIVLGVLLAGAVVILGGYLRFANRRKVERD